eukprot:10417425-Lingulodinium_polyedra.AAC.1
MEVTCMRGSHPWRISRASWSRAEFNVVGDVRALAYVPQYSSYTNARTRNVQTFFAWRLRAYSEGRVARATRQERSQ